MKTLTQKLPIDSDASFVARTYRTPYFETPWHQHSEYELTMISEGNGTAFVGDFIGEYRPKEVYLLGKNLAHWFRKQDPDTDGSSIVVHFKENFLGHTFFEVPEMKQIKVLLQDSAKGLKLTGSLLEKVRSKLLKIEKNPPVLQLMELISCLHDISISTEYELLNQSVGVDYSPQDQNQIKELMEFSMQHFRRQIRLSEVAALTNKSVPAFCQYFKKSTKKSYITFLTEIRIAHACKLLQNSDKSITEICYESGFQNWANFSKHFKTHQGMSPKHYKNTLKLARDSGQMPAPNAPA